MNLRVCQCRHWGACANSDGGCCALGRYGGSPSFGTCGICSSYDGPDGRIEPPLREEPASDPAQVIAHAAVGIIRAQTGAGGAGKELIDRRTAICQTCDKAQIRAGVFHQCTVCGCSTWHKVRNESEKCPMGKW